MVQHVRPVRDWPVGFLPSKPMCPDRLPLPITLHTSHTVAALVARPGPLNARCVQFVGRPIVHYR
jgi:hypothetical protein